VSRGFLNQLHLATPLSEFRVTFC